MTGFWRGLVVGAAVGILCLVGWFLLTYDVNWGDGE